MSICLWNCHRIVTASKNLTYRIESLDLRSEYIWMNTHTHTILIVDDTPDNLELIANFLRKSNYRLLMAKSGDTCLQQAIHGKPDLILLDLIMKGMNGFETCQKLKADERLQNIPVIMMTGLTDMGHKVKGFAAGAVDYVTKPIRREELLARISTHLRIRDLTQNLESLVASRTVELTRSLEREQFLAEELQHSLAQAEGLAQLQARIIETASHEFRTPLTAINQAAGLLNKYYDRLSDEQRQRNFLRITDSVFAIDKLLRNITTVHKVDMGNMLVTHSAVPYATFCTTLQEKLLAEFPRSAHLLLYDIIEADVGIFTDFHIVHQILSILIDNALRYSEPNYPVKVTVTLNTNMISIEVADEGIGIPSAEQPMVYDLFVRASNVGTRRGLGIGLYIAKRLAEKLDGCLQITSPGENEGTIATLHLPYQPEVQVNGH